MYVILTQDVATHGGGRLAKGAKVQYLSLKEGCLVVYAEGEVHHIEQKDLDHVRVG